jgi:hypothetical protein
MMEVLAGAALTAVIAMGGAVMRLFFTQSKEIEGLKRDALGRDKLDTERTTNTTSALMRIERAVQRVDEKVDHMLLKGVPNAVSQ